MLSQELVHSAFIKQLLRFVALVMYLLACFTFWIFHRHLSCWKCAGKLVSPLDLSGVNLSNGLFSFWRCSKTQPLRQLICSLCLSAWFFSSAILIPTLPLPCRRGLMSLCLHSLEAIHSLLLLGTDGGQYGSLAAKVIITHAAPTEGMALWTFQPSRPAVRAFLFCNWGCWSSCLCAYNSMAKTHPGKDKKKWTSSSLCPNI